METRMQNDILIFKSQELFSSQFGKSDLVNELNERASEGWRLVQVVKLEGDLLHYLERPHPIYK